MSDFLNTTPEIVSSAREAMTEAGAPVPEAPARGEREGLPRGYRMRADRHYVEQLASRAAGQPVRMLPLNEIDSIGSFPQVDNEPLIQSIRTHGILHPLLVRRNLNRYAVIAGRKRLAAAVCLRLSDVPCLVHEADDAQAAALAQADNLVVSAMARIDDGSALVSEVQRAVAQHLATANDAALLMSNGSPRSVMSRAVLDLVKAHTWRASRLLDAVALITGTPLGAARDRLVTTIVEQVVEGFSAEARLNGFTMRAQILDGVPSICLDQPDVLAGVSGAVLAMLPLIEHVEQPTILLRVSGAAPSLTIDVVQPAGSVPSGLASRFFDKTASDRPGGWSALAGALAAKTFAERHGGHAVAETGSNANGGVRLVLPRYR